MFGDLDKSLENILKQNLEPDLVNSVAISFNAPDSKFPPAWIKLPAIDLFLYSALENLELRNTEWIWEKGKSDTGSVKKPQVQIECSYIITAWTSDTSPNHMLEEHRLLGQAMKSLLLGRTFPRDSLYGCLKDGTATIIRAEALQPEDFNMGPFWQAMGVKPRVAINYQVTLSVGLLQEGLFIDSPASERAVHLLQHIVDGSLEAPEYELPLNKVLCGRNIAEPVARNFEITDTESFEVENLLQSVIRNWSALGNISVDGFRVAFLRRQGVLIPRNGDWLVQVERQTHDILLDKLERTINVIRLPWLEDLIYTEW